MKQKIEIRSLPTARLEIRTDADGNKRATGYLAVYNQRSVDLGGFVEKISPGAFTDSLKTQPDVRLLVNHDWSKPLARTAAGTLSLRDDSTGLGFSASLPDTTYARDLAESISRGDVSGCSFGFCCAPNGDAWGTTEDGRALRTLNAVNLSEGSIVTAPAYPQTSVSLRSCPAEIRSLLGDLALDIFDTNDDDSEDDSDDDDIDPVTGKKKKKNADDSDISADDFDDTGDETNSAIRRVYQIADDYEQEILSVILAKRAAAL